MMQEKNELISEFSKRILQVIDYLNLNPLLFSKKIGLNKGNVIYDALRGKSKPSFEFFNAFVNSEYSKIINVEWLISGKGNMLKNEREYIKIKGEGDLITFRFEEIIRLDERKDLKIKELEKQILVLQAEKKEYLNYGIVAEPEPKLIKNKKAISD